MKAINKILFMALAAGLSFTSCSDDENFTAGVADSGAYVNAAETSLVLTPDDEQVLTISVGRSDASAAGEVALKGSNDKFQVPATVSFGAGEKNKDVQVPFNMEIGTVDTLVVSVDGTSTNYGFSQVQIIVNRDYLWESLGKDGQYYDGFVMEDGPYAVEILQNTSVPTQFRIVKPYDRAIADEEWSTQGNQSPYITIDILQPGQTLAGVSITQEDLVYFSPINTGYYNTSNDYNQDIWALHGADDPKQRAAMMNEDVWANSRVVAYQDNGLPGQIQLAAYYYMNGIGGWDYTTQPLINIVFPGFKELDFSLTASFNGLKTDVAGYNYALVNLGVGEDIEEVKYALVSGTKTSGIVDGILDGSVEAESIEAGGELEVQLDGAGIHTLVVVGLAGGQLVAEEFESFTTDIPAPDTWKELGTGLYTDEVLLSLYGVDPYQWKVEIEESATRPGVYRLVAPYGEAFPYNEEGDWDDSRDWNIEINAQDPDAVYIAYQNTGLNWGDGKFYIQSLGSYYLDGGVDFATGKAAGYFGTLKDGVITFPVGGVLATLLGTGTWQTNDTGATEIVLPEAVPAGDEPAQARKAVRQFKHGQLKAKPVSKMQLRRALVTD